VLNLPQKKGATKAYGRLFERRGVKEDKGKIHKLRRNRAACPPEITGGGEPKDQGGTVAILINKNRKKKGAKRELSNHHRVGYRKRSHRG